MVPLLLRAAVGLVVLAHAWHTVFTWGKLHLPWPGTYLAAYAELLGAALLLVGLFTRWAGLALAVILGVAIVRVHWGYGLRGPGGFDLPLVLCAGALALVFLGGGWLSLDRHLLGEA